MICRHVNVGGNAAIVCSRKKVTRCYQCNQPGRWLCDYPVDRNGNTCDRPMCNAHRVPVGELGTDRDYCPEHYKESLHDEHRATPR